MLKTIILDRGDHQKGQSVDHDQDRHVFCGPCPAKTIEEENRGRNHEGGCRNRESVKVITANDMDLGVEPCQPKCTAGYKNKCCQPSQSSKGLKGPQIDQDARCHAKGYSITQGIIFKAKPAHGPCYPRDLAVQPVKDGRYHDSNGSLQVLALGRGHNGIKATKKVGRRKKVRQDIDPAL